MLPWWSSSPTPLLWWSLCQAQHCQQSGLPGSMGSYGGRKSTKLFLIFKFAGIWILLHSCVLFQRGKIEENHRMSFTMLLHSLLFIRLIFLCKKQWDWVCPNLCPHWPPDWRRSASLSSWLFGQRARGRPWTLSRLLLLGSCGHDSDLGKDFSLYGQTKTSERSCLIQQDPVSTMQKTDWTNYSPFLI